MHACQRKSASQAQGRNFTKCKKAATPTTRSIVCRLRVWRLTSVPSVPHNNRRCPRFYSRSDDNHVPTFSRSLRKTTITPFRESLCTIWKRIWDQHPEMRLMTYVSLQMASATWYPSLVSSGNITLVLISEHKLYSLAEDLLLELLGVDILFSWITHN